MTEGLRSSVGVAAPPFTKSPYTWEMDVLGIAAGAELHSLSINSAGTLGSGSGLVGFNVITTTAGTAGSWACGIYAKVVEGTTKNVNGYLNAAEFELAVAGSYNPSDMCVLALNSTITNSAMANCSHPAYMHIHEYGSATMNNLFWFAEAVKGADGDTTSLLAASVGPTANATIKFLIGDTPYWILCSSAQT